MSSESSDDIALRVWRALLANPTTHDYAYGINVVVEDGVVRLLGEVPYSAIKDLIGAVAEAVPDVPPISNEIEVWPRDGYSYG